MKLEKLEPGMLVWGPPRRQKMGNTTASRTVCFQYKIEEVDLVGNRVLARWNIVNKARWYTRRDWGKWRYKRPKGA